MNGKGRFMLAVLWAVAAANAVVVLTGKGVPKQRTPWENTSLQENWKSRVLNMIGEGHRQEAILMLRSYLRYVPDDGDMRRLLGKLLFEVGRYDEARDAYYAALMNDPDDFVARNNMGVVLMRQGKLEDARRELKDAFDASEQEVFVAANLACCRERSGDAVGAENIWRVVREAVRNNGDAMIPEDALLLANAENIIRARKQTAAGTLPATASEPPVGKR